MTDATGTIEVQSSLSAEIVHVPREDGQVSVTATITVTIGETDRLVGRAGAVVDFKHAEDVDIELRQHCAALGITISPGEGRKCKASDATAVTAGWEEWRVLVPGAMVGGDQEAPEFDDTWMPVAGIKSEDGQIVFGLPLADGDGGHISFEPDQLIQVSEGW